MDRQLIEHLPVVLRDVPEFSVLMEAWQPELLTAWAAQDGVLENQFVQTATEYGIRRWESILRIFPKDTDTLEMRRARILAAFRLKLPYTVRWLRNWLDEVCGAGNYRLDIVEYLITLALELDSIPDVDELAENIIGFLHYIKPANMLMNYSGMRQVTGTMAVGGISEMSVTLEVWPEPTT